VAYPRAFETRIWRSDGNTWARNRIGVPMFVGMLGDNLIRYEIRKSLESPGAPVPSYVYIGNFWLRVGRGVPSGARDLCRQDLWRHREVHEC
jgi:hypothetical protein